MSQAGYGPAQYTQVWKYLCICENEATIDYQYGFAL